MPDIFGQHSRSYIMSKIKSKNTKPEILVRKYLHSCGFRFRVHDKKLSGNPDIVLKKYKTIIFINGCFWHGHENCKNYKVPRTRTDWWIIKMSRTKERDQLHYKTLKEDNWKIIVIWECELKENASDRLQRLVLEIKQ